jgi:hypothetical protein
MPDSCTRVNKTLPIYPGSTHRLRRGLLPADEMALFLDFWQTRRDGERRGIVEVNSRSRTTQS